MTVTASKPRLYIAGLPKCPDENLKVNSFTQKFWRTTRPQFLVILTYFLVAEDARTLEFCYPVNFPDFSNRKPVGVSQSSPCLEPSLFPLLTMPLQHKNSRLSKGYAILLPRVLLHNIVVPPKSLHLAITVTANSLGLESPNREGAKKSDGKRAGALSVTGKYR